MAFNAEWNFEKIAITKNISISDLLAQLFEDFGDMVDVLPVYKLEISSSGNYFRVLYKDSKDVLIPKCPGFYSIFTEDFLYYFGKADNLYRRQIDDPDNTADSNKIFKNQKRAILKYLIHNNLAKIVKLEPIFIQLYPANFFLPRRNQAFEAYYHVSGYLEELESAISVFAPYFLKQMLKKGIDNGVIENK